jgi:hypothetical protein
MSAALLSWVPRGRPDQRAYLLDGALTARGPIDGAWGCINRRRPSLRQVYALTVAPWMLSSAAGGQHATCAVTKPADLNPRLPPGRRSRSCGNNGGGRQMSGSQQKADPKLCWNCGKRGIPNVGSRMTCPECEVTWMPWLSAARGDPNKVCWEGKVIFCVDFSRPGALAAPA